ncbi:MAG: hypothetical protein WA952_09615, partial [Lewinella sp.]
MIPKTLWLVLCLLGTGMLAGQGSPLSNIREKTVAVNPAGQLVDTLTLAPGSFEAYFSNGDPVPERDYTL